MRADTISSQKVRECLQKFGLSPNETDSDNLYKIELYIYTYRNKINFAYMRAVLSNFKQGTIDESISQSYDYLMEIMEEKSILKPALNDKHDIITQHANVKISGYSMTIKFKDNIAMEDQIAVFEYIRGNDALKASLEFDTIKFQNVIIDNDLVDKFRGDNASAHNDHHILRNIENATVIVPLSDRNLDEIEHMHIPVSIKYSTDVMENILQYANIKTSDINMVIEFKDNTSVDNQFAVFEYIKGHNVLKENLRFNKIKFENARIDNDLITRYSKDIDAGQHEHDNHHILSNIKNAIIVLPVSYINLDNVLHINNKRYYISAIKDITSCADLDMSGNKMKIEFKKNSTAKEQEKAFSYIENNSILKDNLLSNKIEFNNVIITQDLVNTRGYKPCWYRQYNASCTIFATYPTNNGNNAFKRSPLFDNIKSAIFRGNIIMPEEISRVATHAARDSFSKTLLHGVEIIRCAFHR